jgi:hypothetical protein
MMISNKNTFKLFYFYHSRRRKLVPFGTNMNEDYICSKPHFKRFRRQWEEVRELHSLLKADFIKKGGGKKRNPKKEGKRGGWMKGVERTNE